MKITQELELKPPKGCSCHDLQLRMDVLGVDGCRKEFTELKAEISLNLDKWGWTEFFSNFATGLVKAISTGIAWRLNPIDPIGSLLREAIKRAEAR